MVETSHR